MTIHTQKEKSQTKTTCPYCLQNTYYDIIAEHKEKCYHACDEYSKEEFYVGTVYYHLFQCQGCREFFYQTQYVHFEDTSWYDTFPSINNEHKKDNKIIDALQSLEDGVFCVQLYHEISQALNNENILISSLGMRTLLDTIILSLTANDPDRKDGFAEHLKTLVTQQKISDRDGKLLDKVLNVGHSVTHRQNVPNLSDVCFCMDIIENLIKTQIIWPIKSESLEKYKKEEI